MDQSLHHALAAAVRTLLRPLVRILLRNGVAYGTFSEIARKTYVDVAHQDFTLPGKKQTISRVSVLTGLTRKETRRLLETGDTQPDDGLQRYNRAIRVISGWLHDTRFLDSKGRPTDLPLEGENSFSELVRAYSGDMPVQAMLTVLEGAGSARRKGDSVRLVRHAYVPGNDPVDKIAILGTDTGELIATIDHNLTADPQQLRYQRKVSNDNVSPAAVAEFRKLAATRSQSLLEELDDWLTLHESKPGETGTRLCLGIYYFEKEQSPEDEP